ncbi:MAG: hypothetical protein V4689_01480 [Verrucomicrobiota bacterium]
MPSSSPLTLLMFFVASFGELAFAVQAGPLTAADYKTTDIEGWTIRVEKSLDTHPRRAEALKLISTKLAKLKKAVPAEAVAKLKKVPIWLSRNAARGAAYHPSAEWLAANGRVVEMERSIEIANIDDFIDWSVAQPEMLLHELTHAWHHQVANLGYGNPVIKKAYDSAVIAGKYELVGYYDGQKRRAYALNNEMEYFAECSEAYFGKNDFEPFRRPQLKTFDPAGYRMVRKLWGITAPP